MIGKLLFKLFSCSHDWSDWAAYSVFQSEVSLTPCITGEQRFCKKCEMRERR